MLVKKKKEKQTLEMIKTDSEPNHSDKEKLCLQTYTTYRICQMNLNNKFAIVFDNELAKNNVIFIWNQYFCYACSLFVVYVLYGGERDTESIQ